MHAETPVLINPRLVIDPWALQMLLIVVPGWLDRREPEALAYLSEETVCSGGSFDQPSGLMQVTTAAIA